jgi:hypothetical protein
MPKWDELRHARELVKPNKPISLFPVAFKIVLNEIRELKNEVKKLKYKNKKSSRI